MELDFQMISHLIEKGCSCLNATKAWKMRKTPEGEFIRDTTGYKIIFEGILIMESSCIHLKSEAEKLERSFTAVDSEINRFRATYDDLQQSMRQKRGSSNRSRINRWVNGFRRRFWIIGTSSRERLRLQRYMGKDRIRGDSCPSSGKRIHQAGQLDDGHPEGITGLPLFQLYFK